MIESLFYMNRSLSYTPENNGLSTVTLCSEIVSNHSEIRTEHRYWTHLKATQLHTSIVRSVRIAKLA